MSRHDIDSPDYCEHNLGDPRETPDEKEIYRLERENAALRAALAAAERELEQTRKRFDQLLPGEHIWATANEIVKWPHCKVCGIIQRADRKNTPLCKGWTKIVLRAESAESALSDLRAKGNEALHLLERLSQWDMMDTAADGRYWREEIRRVKGNR